MAESAGIEMPSDRARTVDCRCKTALDDRSMRLRRRQSARRCARPRGDHGSILVRRGYRDLERARAFVAGEIEPHDPFLLGDMTVAVDRIRAAIAAGGGSASTATTTWTASRHGARRSDAAHARRRRRVASAEPIRGGLRRLDVTIFATRRRGLQPPGDRRLRDHSSRGGRGCEGARPRRDRHRPPPPRRQPAGLPNRRDAPVGLSVPGALRHRRRLQARTGARRRCRAVSRPGRARHDRRRRPAARREPLPRDRGPARARPYAAARPSGADAEREGRPRRRRRRGRRIPARAADQRRRPAGAPTPHSSCC